MRGRPTSRDLQFIIETLLPGRANPEKLADQLRADETRLAAMLDEAHLFHRLMNEENILLQVSPWLFFTVLLRRARYDLERESFTVEQRGRQKLVLFDTDRVVQLLANEPVRDYLATLLASFTRIENVTVLVEVKPGNWRGYQTNELNVEGMIRYSQTLDEPFRFAPYRRIADACLFLTGMFPEYINGRSRYPSSGQVRPRLQGQLCQRMEDYEGYGQAFYRLAAEHEVARREELAELLATLSEQFILAEKPLVFLANRYLRFTRHTLFEV